MPDIRTTKDLRDAVRGGAFTWPGGYPLFFMTQDGCALSFRAVRENYRQVLRSVKHNDSDGWHVIAVDVNWENADLTCEHTNEHIPCAYGD